MPRCPRSPPTPRTRSAAIRGAAAGTAAVPSAFDAAVSSALGGGAGLGSFGAVGTGGLIGTVPTAAEVAAGLTAAGFAPGTAANLAGLTQAGVGAAGAGASALSASDILRGLNTVRGLMGGQQPTGMPQGGGAGYTPQAVDYSGILNLLASKPQEVSLLGTRFQPENASIAEYLRAEKIKSLLG